VTAICTTTFLQQQAAKTNIISPVLKKIHDIPAIPATHRQSKRLCFTGIYFESLQVFIVGSDVNRDISVTMTDRIRTGWHGSSSSIGGRVAQPAIQWVSGVQQNFNIGTK